MTQQSTADPLSQLEGYLAQDPGNDGLRAEAFETALRAGQRDRAKVHLDAGLGQGTDPVGWRLREAHWLMAAHEWQQADAVLGSLRDAANLLPALDEAIRGDMALIALRTGQVDAGLAELSAWRSGDKPTPVGLQTTLLRLLHHAGLVEELVEQAKRWEAAGSISPEAAGVASLAALDATDLALADGWSRQALVALPRQLEALVTQGTLALARRSHQDARGWLQRALHVHPTDGRAWSAWAFTDMLAGDLPAARQSFERAVQHLPEHIGTWHGKAWAALAMQDIAAAREDFVHALEMDRNFAESHGGMAVVHARSGDKVAAEESIAIALRLDRTCMSAHYAQAVLDGRADDAEALQQLATRLLAARAQSARR
jgi:tetratricopeptide (TPR) repeat protein